RLGDPVAGLDMVARLLDVQGRVLPMAAVPLDIEADVVGLDPNCPDEVTLVRGQARVATTPGEVQAVRLLPADPPACPESVEAVLGADHVVLGPGSWFTSVLPHLLVPELAEAIVGTHARRHLTMNLVAAAETAGLSASAHLEVLAEHAPRLRLDTIICDPSYAAGDPYLARYAASLGAELVIAPVRASDGGPRHDVNRLASVYADVMGR
ncbi:MAG: 2-phospho-L-lactate transferase CofD family protein, partial [Actinomycetes bacterium]